MLKSGSNVSWSQKATEPRIYPIPCKNIIFDKLLGKFLLANNEWKQSKHAKNVKRYQDQEHRIVISGQGQHCFIFILLSYLKLNNISFFTISVIFGDAVYIAVLVAKIRFVTRFQWFFFFEPQKSL